MVSLSEIIDRLDGNGYTPKEILEIQRELTQLAIIKEKVAAALKDVYEDDELEELLGVIEVPDYQQQVLSNSLTTLSEREKQCYVMHVVDRKSFGMIAEELGLSKGTIYSYFERAKEKIHTLM